VLPSRLTSRLTTPRLSDDLEGDSGEQAEASRLRQAGLSIRAIAVEEFDNARYRGRAERVLAKAELSWKLRPPRI
jgi:hypothetical protein